MHPLGTTAGSMTALLESINTQHISEGCWELDT